MFTDFVVMSKDHKPTVLVEARARQDTSNLWAKQFADNFLEQFPQTGAPFFVLVTLEKTYIWDSLQSKKAAPEPTCTLDTNQLLGNLMPAAGEPQLGAYSFELLIRTWLEGLAGADPSSFAHLPGEIAKIGLADAIRQGTIVSESAA